MKALAALALVTALVVAGCSGTDGSDGADGSGGPDGSGARDDPSSAAPSPSGAPEEPVDLADTDVCGLVRQGIDEFNAGDLDATIERFEEALPLAESLAEDEPSDGTETLRDAVRYYAELPAEDYVEANQSSPEFLEFKDFTLTECAYSAQPGVPTDTGVPA